MKKLKRLMALLLISIVCQGAMAQGTSTIEEGVRLFSSNDANHGSLNNNMISLAEYLSILEQEFDVTFLFKNELLVNKYIDQNAISEKDRTGRRLSQILNKLELSFQRIDEQTYVLLDKEVSLTTVQVQEEIRGTVTDTQTGETLPGVNIMVKGTTTGASTDQNGRFELTVSSLQDTLIFSFIGYQTQEVPIEGRNEIDVALQSQAISGEELVVVGYGTQEKANLTGSVDAVQSDMIEDRPIVNTAQGLQGTIPNLNVTIQSGNPHNDSDVSYNIRGFESISGGSPLILVDGVPMNLQSINPNDIESVTVLKDAASAAIYGARAAFGVVLVTTKSGGEAGVNVNYSSSVALNEPIFNMDILDNSCDYAKERNRAAIRGDGSPTFNEDFVESACAYTNDPTNNPEFEVLPDGTIEYYGWTDHRAETIRDYSPQSKHDLSISGGTERSNYYASLSMFKHDGLYELGNDTFKRYNLLLKAEFDINDWIKLDENVKFNRRESNKPHIYHENASLNTMARVTSNVMSRFPLIEGLEEYEGEYFGGNTMLGYLANGGRDITESSDTWLRSGITLTPSETIEIRGEFAYNSYNRSTDEQQTKVQFINNNVNEISFNNGFSSDDYIISGADDNQYYKFETYANFENNFAAHNVGLMIGYSQELYQNSFIQSQAYGVITPSVPHIAATLGQQQTTGSKSELALRGGFYRINYSYDDRYLIESNGRYDGSSRFPKDDRFGFFPSVSVGWRLSEESFMEKTSSYIDDLKIRASYGTLGNQDVTSFYPAISTMDVSLGNYILSDGPIPIVNFAGLISPTLSWESVTTKNAGLDVAMFGNQLEASFDIYTRDTKDMLMGTNYPGILGADSPPVNAADLRTKGWELALTWRQAVNSDLNFEVTGSVSDWISEITKYEGNPNGSLNDYYEGMRIGEIWGYQVVGIFQSEEDVTNAPDQSHIAGGTWRPGDIQYMDLNGDGIIGPGSNTLGDSGDRTVIGNDQPRYSFGLNLNVQFKNWGLSTFFQGVGKRNYWPAGGENQWFWPYGTNTMIEKWHVDESWSEDNRDALFHAPSIRAERNRAVNDRYLQNAAYIRIKNLRLTYNLPENLITKLGIKTAQLYASGQNLGEVTNIHRPLDPETIFSGNIQYPHQRTYSVGLNISF